MTRNENITTYGGYRYIVLSNINCVKYKELIDSGVELSSTALTMLLWLVPYYYGCGINDPRLKVVDEVEYIRVSKSELLGHMVYFGCYGLEVARNSAVELADSELIEMKKYKDGFYFRVTAKGIGLTNIPEEM